MNKRALILGGTGFLGKHVTEAFCAAGWQVTAAGKKRCDLADQDATWHFINDNEPDTVVHLAAKCGGIGINQRQPADFFLENMRMGLNVIDACSQLHVPRLIVAGSICAFPHTPPHIPFVEEDLHAGLPERTNLAYGIVKRDLSIMLDAYRKQHGLDGCYLMPTNLIGPGDNFNPETSHVIPAIISRVMQAKAEGKDSITLWGTGTATRDFLDVRDAARAFVLAAERPGVAGPLNLGSGREVSIRTLAEMVCDLCEWSGTVLWDAARPDGQPRRVLDSTKAREQLDWQALIPLATTLKDAIRWWKEQVNG